jgi:hypothetical protein
MRAAFIPESIKMCLLILLCWNSFWFSPFFPGEVDGLLPGLMAAGHGRQHLGRSLGTVCEVDFQQLDDVPHAQKRQVLSLGNALFEGKDQGHANQRHR